MIKINKRSAWELIYVVPFETGSTELVGIVNEWYMMHGNMANAINQFGHYLITWETDKAYKMIQTSGEGDHEGWIPIWIPKSQLTIIAKPISDQIRKTISDMEYAASKVNYQLYDEAHRNLIRIIGSFIFNP